MKIILWLGVILIQRTVLKEGREALDKHRSKQEEVRRNVLMEFPLFLVYLTHPKLSINTTYSMTLPHNSRRI